MYSPECRIQWWVQGVGLFLDQSEVQRAEKIFLETSPPPSKGLDPPMGLLILQ